MFWLMATTLAALLAAELVPGDSRTAVLYLGGLMLAEAMLALAWMIAWQREESRARRRELREHLERERRAIEAAASADVDAFVEWMDWYHRLEKELLRRDLRRGDLLPTPTTPSPAAGEDPRQEHQS